MACAVGRPWETPRTRGGRGRQAESRTKAVLDDPLHKASGLSQMGDPLSETGVLGDFWGRIKGAKYRFALQDGTWDIF